MSLQRMSLLVMAAFLTSVAPGHATAQENACATVECHMQAGLAARQSNRDEDAVTHYQAAYELGHGARALAQLALAEQAIGRWAAANTHLSEALARDDAWIASHREVLESAQQTITSHLGTLIVVSNVQGAVLSLDGVAAGELPLEAPVAAESGTVVLELRADGYVTVQRRAEITAGQLARVNIDLVPVAERAGTLMVSSNVEGAEVALNGAGAGALPWSEPSAVQAGTVVIDVSSDGYNAARRTVEIRAGELTRVTVDLITANGVGGPTTGGVGEGGEVAAGMSPLFLVGVIGVGLSVASAAGMFGALAVREDNVLFWNDPANCNPVPDGRLVACPDTPGAWEAAESAAIALGVLSGVLLAVSVPLLVLSSGDDGDETSARLDVRLSGNELGLRARVVY